MALDDSEDSAGERYPQAERKASTKCLGVRPSPGDAHPLLPPGSDDPGDPRSVAAHPVDLLRRLRIEELETDEVEAGLGVDDSPVVIRLVRAEYGEVDPGEAGMEPGTPDHVGDIESAAVLESRQPFLDAELFLYPGDRHLFADNSLPDYDEPAATLLKQRVLSFLDNIE
jgi:hypothetical protein